MAIKEKQKKKFDRKAADNNTKVLSHGEHCISFSFNCITNNKKYNFEYFKNSKYEYNKMAASLLEKLMLLSQYKWEQLIHSGRKNQLGFEDMQYGEIGFNTPREDFLSLSKDSKVYVFRFNNNKMRMISAKRDKCPIIHIIGFDFDFSAYDHG
ncbi:MAG: hypothetical protein MRZ66_01690 [Clostridiales bacterium]|nr:hypothetical protein [Clostridiales bacterium]